MSMFTQRRLARRLKIFAVIAVLVAGTGVVWITGTTSLGFFLSEVRTRATANLAVQSAVLEGLLDKFRLMAPLLARSPEIARIVSEADEETGSQLSAVAAGMAGAEEVWMLSARGDLIATSNKERNINRSASLIPVAFEDALRGQLGRELLPGSTTTPASYVFASQVRSGDQVTGVLAVRVSLAYVEQAWALSKDPIVAVDSSGLVVVTNVSQWRGKNLEDLGHTEKLSVIDTSPNPVNFNRLADRGISRSRMELAAPLPVLGWRVMTFADTTEARRQSARAMVISLLLCVIVLGFVWIWLSRREEFGRRQRLDRAAALRLERRVRTRTAELSAANAQLEQEVRDREQAEAELRQAQAELVQAAKLATLGKMSAALSHEYNQPLAAIRSDAEVAEMLIARGMPEKALANLTRIGGMVGRMAEIARTLKGFTRRSGTEIKPVSLRQVIDEALLLLMPQIKQSGVAFETDLPADDIIVSAGQIRLEQVVVNLMTNALDAVKGRKDACVRLSMAVEDGHAVLSVTDNGPGISEDVLPQIFDPFFTTKDVGAGLGLGLSIAYKIVHDFSGTLTAVNGPSGGASFTMRLPVAGTQTLAAE
ncbi:sensor histidine kinase [Roseibium suaedae]|uniref:C4-dicarboxylate transport sensor protein DctB n=1 Tax=Roseibium suaedae TaxID=735517 RepID=A0A1M7M9H6_9HYPH|nr:ATP-binding protein [Roseibium suaedae]SHM87409.1 two-component system, NtrC family, C4-dicarboxylate transport sensor histidine kinase DctB [Roseibium suaedae]